MEASERSSRNSYVRSLARGLSVIRSFTAESPVKTVSQVAKMAGLDRAGARRMLHTLEVLGYAQREGTKFHLTPRVLDLAHIYLPTTALWGSVEPVLQKLAREVREACSATTLDGTEIVHVVGVPGPRLMTAHVAIGSRLPAYCTSTGRLLLGELSNHELDRVLKASKITKQTRYSVTSIPELKRIIRRDHKRGWSFLNQEIEEGLCGLAVPITLIAATTREPIPRRCQGNDFQSFAPIEARCTGDQRADIRQIAWVWGTLISRAIHRTINPPPSKAIFVRNDAYCSRYELKIDAPTDIKKGRPVGEDRVALWGDDLSRSFSDALN